MSSTIFGYSDLLVADLPMETGTGIQFKNTQFSKVNELSLAKAYHAISNILNDEEMGVLMFIKIASQAPEEFWSMPDVDKVLKSSKNELLSNNNIPILFRLALDGKLTVQFSSFAFKIEGTVAECNEAEAWI